jgi:hypothetical protein
MGIESLLRFGVKLQDEFHIREVIPQASIDGFAGIGKVLSLTGIRRPLALAKILAGSYTLKQPPHNAILVNKSVNTK